MKGKAASVQIMQKQIRISSQRLGSGQRRMKCDMQKL